MTLALFVASLSMFPGAPAQAATFIVDSTGDGSDSNLGDGNCRAPGNVCTLRAAIQEANALAGPDSIHFGIGTGAVTISPGSTFPNITSVITIDGTTQPGYAGVPLIEVSGASAGIAHAFTIVFSGSSGSSIRGLVINRFNGTAIRILSGSSNNVIAGNYLGTDASGTLAQGSQVGIYLQGSGASPVTNNRIGGTVAADRNIISGNTVDGMQLDGVGTTGNLVQGNYIGLDVTGAAAVPNGSQGIAIFNSASGNVIGGTAAGARNVISGNGNLAVTMSVSGTTGNRLEGNYIGTDALGTTAIGNVGGVDIGSSASGNFIGGTAAGAGNRIAFSVNNGITLVAAAGTGNLIAGNEIHSNGGLGIDLSGNGVTLNDPGDGDSGANDIQNYPVLSAATTNGAGSAHFAGSLNSTPSTTFRIELFASTAADPTGFGEGERFLGFTNVTTNASGHAILGVTLAATLTAGELVTATATDPSNNTSEFSAAIVAEGDLIVTTTADVVDGTTTSVSALIASPGADGRISLREAIEATNATAGTDTIRFGIPLSDPNHFYYQDDAIPGSLSVEAVTAFPEANVTDFDPDYPAGLTRSWYRIQPSSTLTSLSGGTLLDASTQPGYLPGGPVIELDGAVAGVNGRGFRNVSGGPITIRGFVLNGFSQEGITCQSSSTVIQGNYIGTDVSGTLARANGTGGAAGIYVGGSSSFIGGTTASERNVISGNNNDSLWIEGDGITIRGNYIGTDVTGTKSLGSGATGIVLQVVLRPTVTGVTIGGSAAGAGNVIAANGEYGIFLNGATVQNNVIEGNLIGTDVTGAAALPNTAEAVRLSGGASGNRIGGTLASASNRIAFNIGSGVVLDATAGAGNSILGNRIYANGGLGIDLGADGVTANDASDVDAGPNNLVNFPFNTAAIESGGNLTVYFKLDVPAASYRIEFFKNPSGADPSGNGEGETLAGSTNVTHPGGGSVDFSHVLAGAVGDVITSTATLCTDGATCAAFGETSEFGDAVTAVTTAVTLTSFRAVAVEEAVDLLWTTGSELNNLGFHLHRSLSPSGPFERITETTIPGLGTSPHGASYRHRDTEVESGVTYYYELEDIETTGRSTFHGPVVASPEQRSDDPPDEERVAYGDPSAVSLQVLDRDRNGVWIELVTGGFFATRLADGAFRLEVPGFEEVVSEGSPALPVKRTWLEALAGRRVEIVRVLELETSRLGNLALAGSAEPEIVASPEGVVRVGARRRGVREASAGVFPETAARVLETGFQGNQKKAFVELAPLRWVADSRQIAWTRRLKVRVGFVGVEPSERASRGGRGRHHRGGNLHGERKVLARMATSRPGLHRVRFEEIFGRGSRPLASSSLGVSRLGRTVPFHLEPATGDFGPGSTIYFLGAGEAVYELEWGAAGTRMPLLDASPSGPPVSSYWNRKEWEQDRLYQAGLLEAPSLWLWDIVLSGASKSYPFALDSLLDEAAELELYLQGASDLEHHVRVLVNGSFASEASWIGKKAKTIAVPLAPGLLKEGANEITVENASAAFSMVFVDRFAVGTSRWPVARKGRLEGRFLSSGAATVGGVGEGSFVVRTSPEIRWIRGARLASGGISFQVEAGPSYLVVSPEAVLAPKVETPKSTGLRSARNRADYLLIGPREFLPAAEPLLERRRRQGLVPRAVPIEDVFDEFGYGEARPEALKEFLEHAYHHWASPSLRYVVLLGDATYDRKDNLGTGVRDRVPTFMLKTSYLWTASDPTYAAVNGKDPLPDVALGRLPAATLREARTLIGKVLAYEESGQDLSGPAILVADDPDAAGDFEASSDEIASGLLGRPVEKIYLGRLGAAETRRKILESLDAGASFLSYVGHGGIGLWASENVFSNPDVAALHGQPAQPIVLTLNCLNGYFHFPYFDALGESLVKAEGKGAIAAFSPSGLSLNGPAHFYHRALMEELTSGRHARLGDAVLAAQRTYAESGLFPELLAIYHLFGDPALAIH